MTSNKKTPSKSLDQTSSQEKTVDKKISRIKTDIFWTDWHGGMLHHSTHQYRCTVENAKHIFQPISFKKECRFCPERDKLVLFPWLIWSYTGRKANKNKAFKMLLLFLKRFNYSRLKHTEALKIKMRENIKYIEWPSSQRHFKV